MKAGENPDVIYLFGIIYFILLKHYCMIKLTKHANSESIPVATSFNASIKKCWLSDGIMNLKI